MTYELVAFASFAIAVVTLIPTILILDNRIDVLEIELTELAMRHHTHLLLADLAS